jgi:hypothetical protein
MMREIASNLDYSNLMAKFGEIKRQGRRISENRHLRRRISRIIPLGLFWFRILFSETYEYIGELVGLLGWGIGPTQGLYLHTGQHKKKKNADTYP